MKDISRRLLALILMVFMMVSLMFSMLSCAEQGEQGLPGKNGLDGVNGKDGITPSIGENGHWWIGELDTGVVAEGQNGRDGVDGKDGINGTDGADGVDGTDGINGTDGKDGKDGKDAVSPQFLYDSESGYILVSYDNRESWSKLVNIDEMLVDGEDGVSIVSCKINESGELVVEYSDETSDNLGNIIPKDGKDGITPIVTIDKVNLDWRVSYDGGETWESLGIVAKGNDGVNGENGKDGEDGITPLLRVNANTYEWEVSYDNGERWTSLGVTCKGEPGADGKSPIVRIKDGVWEISKNNGTTWESTGVKATGKDGVNGKDGKDGTNGKDGKDGVGIDEVFINEDGELTIKLSNGQEFNLGVIKGEDGEKGSDGKNGITPKLRINTDTDLWEVSYDNGLTWASVGVTAGGMGAGETVSPNYTAPRFRINAETKEWEISYDEGNTWTSLGQTATGLAGKDGKDGDDGKDGRDGNDGRGIVKVEVKGGHLFVTYTDSDIPVDLGSVVVEVGNGEIIGNTVTDIYTDALAFYPLNGGSEYGVKIGNAIYLDTIVIPATYNGKPVTTILPNAFQLEEGENMVLRSVVIPSSVTKICDNAFENCAALERIEIPTSVVEIGNYAFFGIGQIVFLISEAEVPEGETWTTDWLGCGEILWKS